MKALVAAHAAAEQFLWGIAARKVRKTDGGLFGYAWHRNADRLDWASHPMWRPTWQSSVPDQV